MLAIPWYFTGVIHEETLFTRIYFCVTCLSLLWGIYAGTLVDKYSRKRVFLAINIVGFAMLGTATAMGYMLGGLHWAVVATVFATTVFIFNIHFPALYAFAQEITPREQYGRVTSQLEVQGQLTWAISGGLAAILLTGMGSHIHVGGMDFTLPFTIRPWSIYEIFGIDAATYLIAFVLIWYIRTLPVVEREADTAPLLQRIRGGFGFLKRHPVLFWFGNASLFVFLTIIVEGTLINPIYVDHFLHRGGAIFALSDMVFSLGALLAGVVTTRLITQRQSLSGIMLLFILATFMYALLTFNTYLLLFFTAHFIIGFCNSASRVLRITYLFSHIPNSVIGRANSVFFVINVALRIGLTGIFAFSFFHQGTNIAWANAIMGAICLIGAVVIYYQRGKLEESPVVISPNS